MNQENLHRDAVWPHRLAVVMACATFPLIWVGGLVTTEQAGMAVPDWPGTFGYNLFLYPLSTWLAGPYDLFIEHGHRLLGAGLGLLAIGLVIAAFRTSSRQWQVMSIVALAAIVFQGVLGGLRVRLDERTLAMIHGCTGPLVFAYLAVLATVMSPNWTKAAPQALPGKAAWNVRRLSLAIGVLAYMQLVVGAQLRHTPIDAGPSFFRAALHFHLLLAAVLILHAAWLARYVAAARQQPLVFWPALALVALVLGQVALGGATWVVKYGWPTWVGEYAFTAGYTVSRQAFFTAWVVTAHVAIGSLILATAALTAVRSFRYLQVSARDRSPIISTHLAGVAA